MSNDAICPLGESEADNGVCQSQPNTPAPPQVTRDVIGEPDRRATSGLGYRDRLERLWLAIERAGEYVRTNGDLDQRVPDAGSGGAA